MTTTLIEKITDTSTTVTFTTTYAVSIPAKVGGSTAFVGFTGGTGGLTATQDIQTWTLRSTPLVILFDCCSPGQTGMSAAVWQPGFELPRPDAGFSPRGSMSS